MTSLQFSQESYALFSDRLTSGNVWTVRMRFSENLFTTKRCLFGPDASAHDLCKKKGWGMMKSVCCLFKGLENSNTSKHRTFRNVTVTGRLFVLKKIIRTEHKVLKTSPLFVWDFGTSDPPKKKIFKKNPRVGNGFWRMSQIRSPFFYAHEIHPQREQSPPGWHEPLKSSLVHDRQPLIHGFFKNLYIIDLRIHVGKIYLPLFTYIFQ